MQPEKILPGYEYFRANVLATCGIQIEQQIWRDAISSPRTITPRHQMPKMESWTPQQKTFGKFCGAEMAACGYEFLPSLYKAGDEHREEYMNESVEPGQLIVDRTPSRSDFIILAAVFVASAFAILLRLPAPLQFVQDQDWSHQLAGANQILRGLHPFVSFQAVYGPLTFYASALFQYVSGTRIIGELILILLGYSIAYTILFWLLRLITGDRLWSLMFLAILVLLVPRFYKYYIVFGPALSLLFIWRYIEHPSYRRLWPVGLAVVVTGLFRADYGAYMVICSTVAILSVPSHSHKRKILGLLYFGGTLLIIASPWLLFLAARGGLANYFYASTFASASTATGMSMSISFSQNKPASVDLRALAALAFFLTPAAAFFLLLQHKHRMPQTQWAKLLSLIVASQLTMFQAMHRSDPAHLLQALPITAVLLAWFLRQLAANWGSQNRILAIAGMVLGVGLFGTMLFFTLPQWRNVSIQKSVDNFRIYSLQRDKFMDYLIGKYRNADFLKAMSFVRSCTDPADEIIAWPYLINFYYFTDRPFGSWLMALSPGYFTSSEYQRLVVQDLEDRRVPFFIFQPQKFTAQAKSIEDYAPIVADYLKATFVPVRDFGKITFYVNRRSPAEIHCPGQ